MRVRSSRIIIYAAGWSALTVLAAGVVWWGLGPLLAPILQVKAAPPPSPVAPSISLTLSMSPTPTSRSKPPPRSARPSPSRYEGWQRVDDAFVQTFELAGGKATVRISQGRVELVSSQPSLGYTITPRQPSPDRLVVDFFNGTNFYVLDAVWWENRPYSKITQVS